MMIRDVSCCKKTRKDSSAGLCSARITILIVDKMKLIQKYVMIIETAITKLSAYLSGKFKNAHQSIKCVAIRSKNINGIKIRDKMA